MAFNHVTDTAETSQWLLSHEVTTLRATLLCLFAGSTLPRKKQAPLRTNYKSKTLCDFLIYKTA